MRDLTAAALEERFVTGARLTATWLRELAESADVTHDELEELARPVLEALGRP